MDRSTSMELMYYPTASTYYRLSISKTESNLDLIYNNGSTESRVWSSKDDLERYDVLTDTPTALEIPLSSYRIGGIIKAMYVAGTHTKDWVAGQTYSITTRGGIYAPKISWSKRIIYKFVSGSPHYAVLSMDTNGVITINPETVAYGGTMRIFETYF